eukprot:6468017-Amphidinium_carterae.1
MPPQAINQRTEGEDGSQHAKSSFQVALDMTLSNNSPQPSGSLHCASTLESGTLSSRECLTIFQEAFIQQITILASVTPATDIRPETDFHVSFTQIYQKLSAGQLSMHSAANCQWQT